jgi:hypothetical protein
MKIQDISGKLEWRCDRCAVSLRVQAEGAVVGLHGPDVRAYHRDCAEQAFQFLHFDADRRISLADFVRELTAAAGLPS